MNAPIELGLLSRCQRRMRRKANLRGWLELALETARELEDIYWEQVRKLTDQTTRGAFRVYAKRFTKDRQKLEKALRSRGVSI